MTVEDDLESKVLASSAAVGLGVVVNDQQLGNVVDAILQKLRDEDDVRARRLARAAASVAATAVAPVRSVDAASSCVVAFLQTPAVATIGAELSLQRPRFLAASNCGCSCSCQWSWCRLTACCAWGGAGKRP